MNLEKLSLSFLALCFVLVHFTFSVLAPCNSWGFDFVSYFPVWGRVLFYVLAVVACFPLYRIKLPEMESGRTAIWVAAVLSFLYFYFVHFKYGFIGDNWLHVGQIERGEWWTIADGKGVGFVMCYFHKLTHLLSHFNGVQSIQLFAAFCGAGYSVYIFKIAGELGKNTFEKIVLFLICITLPLTCQFNGLIEIHALPTLIMTAIYYYSIMALKRKVSIWIPIALFIVFSPIHLLILIVLPAIAFLIIERLPRTERIPISIIFGVIGLVMVTALWDKLKFHPVGYIFSIQNIGDFINGQILGFGSLLFGLLICLVNIKKIKFSSTMLLLLTITILQLGFFFCYNLLLGSATDDLVFFPSFCGALVIMIGLFQLKESIRNYTIKIIIGLLILHSGSRMIINVSDMSIKWYEDNTKNSTASYYNLRHPTEMVMAFTFKSNGLNNKANLYWNLFCSKYKARTKP
jgi:hypothetical protein